MSVATEWPVFHAWETVDPARGLREVEVRPWRGTDSLLLSDAERALSTRSLTARFFTGTSTLPPAYVRRLAGGPGGVWDATVALSLGHLIGWAEYGRHAPGDADAELGVLVVDAWQHCGIGGRLIRALLPRAIREGVRVLHADVEVGNLAAQRAVRTVFGDRPTAVVEGDVMHFTVPLLRPLDEAS